MNCHVFLLQCKPHAKAGTKRNAANQNFLGHKKGGKLLWIILLSYSHLSGCPCTTAATYNKILLFTIGTLKKVQGSRQTKQVAYMINGKR